MTEENNQDRYQRGIAKLSELDDRAGTEIVAPLGDLGRYIMEFGYGDVYSRPGLTLRDRLIVTVSILIALAGREPQLRVHLGSALRVGLTPEELEEIIIHSVLYAGFPTAINAQTLLKEVLAAQKEPKAP